MSSKKLKTSDLVDCVSNTHNDNQSNKQMYAKLINENDDSIKLIIIDSKVECFKTFKRMKYVFRFVNL